MYAKSAIAIAATFVLFCLQAAYAEIERMAPRLTQGADGTLVLSYIERLEDHDALVYRVFDGETFGDPVKIASGDNWFVNWADFPSVLPLDERRWAAHWLVSQPAGGYAYDIAMALSDDGGRSWTEPFLIHDDGTPTEHGFVTLFPQEDAVAAVWLDGRNMAGGHDVDTHGGAGGMTLRSAVIRGHSEVTDAMQVDSLTCDCCQTDVAVTASGPVVVYRDRTEGEIRDIYVSRQIDGVWSTGQPVADDGWQIAGCPVNGPVIGTVGDSLAVTWFSAADDKPRIQTAWSDDLGQSFGLPVTVADVSVVGYVGQASIGDNTVAISWLCGSRGQPLDICYRLVKSNRSQSELQRLRTKGTLARMSVPQIARVDDRLLFVWTDRQEGELGIEHKLVPIPAH